mmetsp:Transcript_25151/g.39497  ORF Transcript_25151/g.39497 Transcript_25151/m.39497 type:complete len:304 (+) Transcript_25151:374-1285(+)
MLQSLGLREAATQVMQASGEDKPAPPSSSQKGKKSEDADDPEWQVIEDIEGSDDDEEGSDKSDQGSTKKRKRTHKGKSPQAPKGGKRTAATDSDVEVLEDLEVLSYQPKSNTKQLARFSRAQGQIATPPSSSKSPSAGAITVAQGEDAEVILDESSSEGSGPVSSRVAPSGARNPGNSGALRGRGNHSSSGEADTGARNSKAPKKPAPSRVAGPEAREATEQEVEYTHLLFSIIDREKKGFIDLHSLTQVVKEAQQKGKMRLSDSELGEMISRFDKGGKGSISVRELEQIVVKGNLCKKSTRR